MSSEEGGQPAAAVELGGGWRRRVVVAASVAVALVAPVAPAVAAPTPSPSAPAQPADKAPDSVEDAAGAVAAARRFNTDVEVSGQRSETTRVWAKPDGSFTSRRFLRPQWSRTADGTWVDADAALRANGDGSVSPVAATVPIRFSGGGGGPAATIRSGDKQLSMSWPTALPAPVLSGESATYREVLPGVDLTLRAEVDGFSTLVVVKTRQAAANPALHSLRFATATKGLTIRTVGEAVGQSRALQAVDARGQVVFGGGAPMMWDSADVARQQPRRLRAEEPDAPSPRRQAPVGVRLQPGALELVPDAGLLADPDAVFPIVIDPTWGRSADNWTLLRQRHPTTSFWRATSTASDDTYAGAAKAGYSSDGAGSGIDRTVFQFDISGLRGTIVHSAVFSMKQLWSWYSCRDDGVEDPPVDLHETPFIYPETTWNTGWNLNGSGWGDRLASNNNVRRYNGSGAKCGPGPATFDITGRMQAKATTHASVIALGIKGRSDAEKSWRRYQLDTAYLSVQYNSYPNRPAQPLVDGKTCAEGEARPKVRAANLSALVSDNDGEAVTAEFHLARRNADDTWPTAPKIGQAVAASGQRAPLTVTGLTEGVYRWTARAIDSAGNSNDNSWLGAWCEFQLDLTAPNPPSGVTSPDYPAGPTPSLGVGRPGTFTISPPAGNPADVAHYVYALTPWTQPPTDGRRSVAVPSTPGSVSITLTPTMEGDNELRVWAVDAAGNHSPLSSPARYAFTVGPGTGPEVQFTMQDVEDNKVIDAGTRGLNATRHGGAVVSGGIASFSGTGSHLATTVPAVDTTRSFSVSAWVNLRGTAGWPIAVAQDGGRVSGFWLEYDTHHNRWAAGMANADADNPTSTHLLSTTVPQTNRWTHLTLVHDAAARQLQLYINGNLEANAAFTATWNAIGSASIGRGRWNGAASNYWTGDIDDVRMWDRVVTGADVAGLLAEAPVAGIWSFDEGEGATTVSDVSGNRPPKNATITGPVSWQGGHDSADPSDLAIWQDGHNAPACTATNEPVVRTDQSFTVTTWAYLTDKATWRTFVAQHGTHRSAIQLQYSKDYDRWVAAVASHDSPTPAGWYAVLDSAPPALDTWVHLAAVYDAATRRLTLYVNGEVRSALYYNGVAQPAGSQVPMWHANGPLTMGCDVGRDYISGKLDDVQAYAGALRQSDIQRLMQTT